MTRLDPAFLARPLAHRGLHGAAGPENSHAAFEAAISRGYGIELDLQVSADGQAMVFHDEMLDRLSDARGPVAARSSADLALCHLKNGEGIPTLAAVLDHVAGRVSLLIEIKDQSGALGPVPGVLEQATAVALAGYGGPVAVMSFNPHAIAAFAPHAPDVARGLVTCDFEPEEWPGLPAERRRALRGIPDFDILGCDFISHEVIDLGAPRVQRLRARGVPVLCWTVTSPRVEARARKLADNITFEGYFP